MFSQTRIMELPGLLGLLGITRITLELLSKSRITELFAQIPSNSGLVTSLTRCWKPLAKYITLGVGTVWKQSIELFSCSGDRKETWAGGRFSVSDGGLNNIVRMFNAVILILTGKIKTNML